MTSSGTTTPQPPVIVVFSGAPLSIPLGQASTLFWQVTGADTVTISSLGSVVPAGSVQVTPSATTTYILTATKGSLTSTQSVTITVTPATTPPSTPAGGVKIISYSQQTLSDGMIQLYCITENAVSIMLNGRTFPYTTEAVLEVLPPTPTNYPCVATGADGTTVTQTLLVP